MLLLLTIILACKKKVLKPQLFPDKTKKICVQDSTHFEGKYYTTNTSSVDTITIVFIKNNCPTEHSNRYVIKNLSNVMATWGVGIIDRDYYINSDEVSRKVSIQDTLKAESGSNYIRISVKDNNGFTPYLVLKKKT